MKYLDRKQESSCKRANILGLAVLIASMLSTPVLAAAPNAGDSDSDSERHVLVHKAVHTVDCPEVKVLGSGGARVLSYSSRGFLGVEASNLTPELRQHFGVSADVGVMLSKILGDSAAEAAGLAVGDIVTRIDGEDISSTRELGRVVRRKEGGDVLDIELWRDGEMIQLTAALEERERCSIDIGDSLRAIDLSDLPRFGELGIEIGGEVLEGTLEALSETLADQDWEEHFRGLEEIEFVRIEERMEHVQERLERLEERLERDFGRELERAEREAERAERESRRELERAEREAERAEREVRREAERAERENGNTGSI